MFEIVQSDQFETWFRKLRDRHAKQIISVRLFRLAKGDSGDAKALGDGLHELRIHFGPGYRLYFQRRGNKIILLLCGGTKDSQKPDIAKARAMAKEWEI